MVNKQLLLSFSLLGLMGCSLHAGDDYNNEIFLNYNNNNNNGNLINNNVLNSSSNSSSSGGSNNKSIFANIIRGACLLGGGAWAFERLKNSYKDWKNPHAQPADFKEDLHNVLASIGCTTMFAHVGGAGPKKLLSVLGSGTVIGAVYLALKRFGTNTKELRLREFVPAVAACAMGREALRKLGLPVIKFGSSNNNS